MSCATLPVGQEVAERVLCQDGRVRAIRVLDLLVKVALVGLLLSALIFPDLSGVKEKAGTARLVVYPLGMVVVPLWWWLYGRRRADRSGRGGFPWAADLLISLP